MGHWNYRVVKRSTDNGGKQLNTPVFGIHEAYYQDEEERPHLITVNPMAPLGDTLEELREVLFEMMGHALDKPVLDWEDFNEKTEDKGESVQQSKKLIGD